MRLYVGTLLGVLGELDSWPGLSSAGQLRAGLLMHLVFPIQIIPCKTRIGSVTLINSFMYHHETIGSTNEGAGWAFPTKTYWHALPTCIYFQGYEILRHSHLPSPTNSYALYILEESLDLNWQIPDFYIEDCLFRKHKAPLQWDWNTTFNSYVSPSHFPS